MNIYCVACLLPVTRGYSDRLSPNWKSIRVYSRGSQKSQRKVVAAAPPTMQVRTHRSHSADNLCELTNRLPAHPPQVKVHVLAGTTYK